MYKEDASQEVAEVMGHSVLSCFLGGQGRRLADWAPILLPKPLINAGNMI